MDPCSQNNRGAPYPGPVKLEVPKRFKRGAPYPGPMKLEVPKRCRLTESVTTQMKKENSSAVNSVCCTG